MRAAWCFLLFISTITQAGVIRGVVLERASGFPMARTIVRLDPVPTPGVELRPLQVRAGTSGQFVFNNVPDGLWILVAVRDYYFPAAYGQRRPEGAGTPIPVTKDSDLFADLHMYRKGAVTGRVLDENNIGMPDVAVVAYRARLPLYSVGRGVSDDRGVYRIHSLAPGKYWIRTIPFALDDGTSRLPTFGRETFELREAFVHLAALDRDTQEADVRPFPGRLFHLSGKIVCNGGPAATVTLSSETGRKSIRAECLSTYTFEGLAPGTYEVLATQDSGEAGFIELNLDHDTDNGNVQLMTPPTVEINVRRPGTSQFSSSNIPVVLIGRRQNLSEVEPEQEILQPRTRLAPGHWD